MVIILNQKQLLQYWSKTLSPPKHCFDPTNWSSNYYYIIDPQNNNWLMWDQNKQNVVSFDRMLLFHYNYMQISSIFLLRSSRIHNIFNPYAKSLNWFQVIVRVIRLPILTVTLELKISRAYSVKFWWIQLKQNIRNLASLMYGDNTRRNTKYRT